MSDNTELLKEYKKLAKRADQRLVRLEAYQHQKGFRTATKWSYSKAMKDISKWSGEGAKRFNTKAPESTAGLKAKIADIKQFLESPTSTMKGIKSVYKKKADTVNKKYGTDFTWEDLANYYTSGLAEKLNAEFGSKTALQSIGEIQKSDDAEVKAIKEGKEKHLKVEDKIKGKIIDKILDYAGFDILDLFF